MLRCNSLSFKANYGIEGDINASSSSPRQILIVSQPIIRDLNLNPADLRENILVDGEIESFSSGDVLSFGEEVCLRLTILCQPCSYLKLIRANLPKQIFRKRGFLARVVRGGTVKDNDEVTLTPMKLAPLSDNPQKRFYDFVAKIPYGKVVPLSDLVYTLDLSNYFIKGLPSLIQKCNNELPFHRLVSLECRLLMDILSTQEDYLRNEGVVVTENGVVEKKYYWDSSLYYSTEEFAASL